MDDVKAIGNVVSLFQVGFSGFVAVFLLVKFYGVISDLQKQQAVLLTLLTELSLIVKEGFKEALADRGGRRKDDEE